jgi:hypothetical protein
MLENIEPEIADLVNWPILAFDACILGLMDFVLLLCELTSLMVIVLTCELKLHHD